MIIRFGKSSGQENHADRIGGALFPVKLAVYFKVVRHLEIIIKIIHKRHFRTGELPFIQTCPENHGSPAVRRQHFQGFDCNLMFKFSDVVISVDFDFFFQCAERRIHDDGIESAAGFVAGCIASRHITNPHILQCPPARFLNFVCVNGIGIGGNQKRTVSGGRFIDGRSGINMDCLSAKECKRQWCGVCLIFHTGGRPFVQRRLLFIDRENAVELLPAGKFRIAHHFTRTDNLIRLDFLLHLFYGHAVIFRIFSEQCGFFYTGDLCRQDPWNIGWLARLRYCEIAR